VALAPAAAPGRAAKIRDRRPQEHRERWGGALTAGLFLKEFLDATPWVHVDLAGPASTDKELGHVGKGGTGFGVATILQFVRSLAA